jgi:hypothetical protein
MLKEGGDCRNEATTALILIEVALIFCIDFPEKSSHSARDQGAF